MISAETLHNVSLIINLFIILSYPLNFFIYCGMSRQFRETFRRLFVSSSSSISGSGNSKVAVDEMTQYVTLPATTMEMGVLMSKEAADDLNI